MASVDCCEGKILLVGWLVLIWCVKKILLAGWLADKTKWRDISNFSFENSISSIFRYSLHLATSVQCSLIPCGCSTSAQWCTQHVTAALPQGGKYAPRACCGTRPTGSTRRTSRGSRVRHCAVRGSSRRYLTFAPRRVRHR